MRGTEDKNCFCEYLLYVCVWSQTVAGSHNRTKQTWRSGHLIRVSVGNRCKAPLIFLRLLLSSAS